MLDRFLPGRGTLAVAALLALAACSDLSRITAPPAAFNSEGSTGHHPILFIHGYNSSGSTWNTMVGRFQNAGWQANELHAWSYNYRLSNQDIATLVATKVDSILAASTTGATRVDIITHSMGGLSSRYYAKYLGGNAKIDAWVSLGGPNHGTRTAICPDVSCGEMRIGSAFLADLNSVDETPNGQGDRSAEVRYATWWSGCDEVIDPKDSVKLSGASNTKTACMLHSRLKEDSKVWQQVRSWVDK